MIRSLLAAIAAAVSTAALLGACSKPAPVTEDVRPVRVLTVAPVRTSAVAEFAGEVRPRVESRVGFQVAGRITSRSVEVGQRVQRGQTLAALDAADYQLGATAARAQVESAKVDRDQQRVDYKRFEDLARQGFISGADLERRKAQLDAAEARYNAAVAQADVSGNQAGYSTLKAPTAGVITAVEAEVGQVVTAGQAVVRIAQTEEKEVAIALPESRLEILRRIPEVKVTLWAGEGELRGRVREIAPLADAATRTYPARITLINAPPNVALGMTATVRFEVPLPQPLVTLPLQALLREGDSTYVWLLEQGSQQVKKSRIEVADVAGNDVVIRSGVMPGATVVTAGVHLLKEGQKVRVLEAEAGPTPATATTTKVPGSSTPQGGSQGKE
jgi:RND family efflux transporter MFP subunit